LPNFLIEQALASELKVALNGTGGDELFAGYPRYFQQPIERDYLRVPRVLRSRLIEPLIAAVDPYLGWRLARAEKFTADRGAYLHEQSAYFPPPLRALIGARPHASRSAQQIHFDMFTDRHPTAPDTAALFADMATYLPEDLLLLLDRTSMAVSVEGRVPYLDHRFVEAALGVPASQRTSGGRQKALQRAMARDFLPVDVLTAPKRGFASPITAWMNGTFGPVARRLLGQPATLDRGWWTKEGIDRLIAAGPRHAHRVYALVMLELAVRLLVERPLETTPPQVTLFDLVAA
jgi:asparagine synthase (glutamine-hydrolysing)